MFLYLILKYKEHAEKVLALIDEYHENPDILNTQAEERIVAVVEHLVKQSDFDY